ncbi:DUF5412 family protein [Clostridium isatidis]|uniref:DUF5412 family protein n=1 Tax=Clostridium isatidis TaxID=182773 RepID=UPI003AB09911
MKKLTTNIIRIVTMLSIIVFLKGCSEKKVEIQKEIISPNGLYTAYVYNFNGGATVGLNQCVSIIESNESEINDILANDSPNIYFNTNTNSKEIDIEWEDDSTLKIIYDENLDYLDYVKLKVDIFNGIKIKYE